MKRVIKLFVAMVLSLLMFTGCSSKEPIELPYDLEDGKLTINALFQSSIDNPDCNNEYADNIASLEIINNSEECLDNATIKVTTKDDQELNFKIDTLPAGKTMWVYDVDNTAIDLDEEITGVKCKSEFKDENLVDLDTYGIMVNNTNVTIQNISNKTIKNINVNVHCLVDDVYSGGTVYTYSIKSLKKKKLATLDCSECVMGIPEVVSINGEE